MIKSENKIYKNKNYLKPSINYVFFIILSNYLLFEISGSRVNVTSTDDGDVVSQSDDS